MRWTSLATTLAGILATTALPTLAQDMTGAGATFPGAAREAT